MAKHQKNMSDAELERTRTRRKFLQFLAASPAIASLGGVSAFMGEAVARSEGQIVSGT